ncbi:AGE family epimerase/isomerase [Fibrella sp. WM1]|uniref:AGE family epimerase/isomerase n=1 Tax=Fibrella musci TaxID=3242485 RepID=UPI0035211A55
MTDLDQFADLYKRELLSNIIPFWQTYSVDTEQGGFFTCLNRDGSVFDTDKFMWLQGRQVWTFAMLYNRLSPKAEWLDMALHGADFMEKHGRADDGNWYFSTTRAGKPLVQPYNIFSDCFATMGFGQLYKATNEPRHADIAQATFQRILDRRHNPKRHWDKSVEGTRPLKNFALPMILCNLSLELEHLLDASLVNNLIDECIHEVMEVFYDESLGLIRENVSPDGSVVDSFEGRHLNPGHAIEAMWFIMDLGERLNNRQLIEKAKDLTLQHLDYGWDPVHGGIFYFLDSKGYPSQHLEWDQKLWWVHVETLVALLKGYQFTGDERCLTWFKKVHDYTFSHFRDAEYGEWFGYLNRQGEVLLPLKGGKWKGCFHIPRALYQCWQVLEKLEKNAVGNGTLAANT